MADIKHLAKVQDIDLASTFQLSAEKLIAMLGVTEPIPAAPGETLKQKKITGTLSATAYVEGNDIPVTEYTTSDVQTFEVTLKPYRTVTKLQDVQKRGYEQAVSAVDAKLINDIQAVLKADFVTTLSKGATKATGTSLITAAANSFAALENTAEELGFGNVTPVFFCNPADFADAIGKSEVFAAFGFNYIANFAGLGNLIATSKVAKGTVYCVAAEDIKAYYIPANEAPGFDFQTDESGYVAVAHDTELKNITYNTVAWTGLTLFAEYTDLVVVGTIAASV